MKKFLFLKKDFTGIVSTIAAACLLLSGFGSCTVLKGPYTFLPQITSQGYSLPVTDSSNWVNWNIIFSPGANDETKTRQIQDVEKYISGYLALYGFTASFTPTYCPCDSTLFNLSAKPLLGSGQSYSSPPPPPPPPGASGDNFPYTTSLNNSVNIDMPVITADDPNNTNPYTNMVISGAKFAIHNTTVSDSIILAIMDTGLDPGYFDNNLGKLIWKDSHRQTMRNFFAFNAGFSAEYMMDDHPGKHGTAVTMLALQAMESVPVYPKIMVLKVLDKNEKGTTFNVGCALSYAYKTKQL